jgi:hypothetical protein
MSMAPSSSPISTWSRGAKPSAAKSRGTPTSSSTTKSSSPPTGASGSSALVVGRLHPRREVGGLRHETVELGLDPGALVVAGLLEPALQRPDLLAEVLLLVAQGTEGDLRRAPRLVGGDEAVDDGGVLASGALRRAHTVGVLAQELEIDHGPSLVGGRPATRARRSTHATGVLGVSRAG